VVAVAGKVLDLDLGAGNALLDQANDVGGSIGMLEILASSVAFI
jgi:hypothetical protein